jgi:excinuclease ABC subunit C
MHSLDDIFTHRLDFDPAAPFEEFLRAAPARWVVYLLADAQDRPIQLLCVKNLRSSLKRRLGEDENAPPSKRVNYREVVRQIHWRRVDSAFEADCVYLEAARALFPQTYQGMVGFRPAWFIRVDPEAQFPRYTKTIDLSRSEGTYIGPLENKNDAQNLIEQVEDWFDLCRYYHILLESPRGKACAYKEMGKCPAPCDGSIGIEQYRRLVDWSLSTLIEPDEMLRTQNARMQAAAKELRFETAAKIKAYIESLSQLGKGPYRYARRLQDFQFLAFQRGPRDGTAKIFLVTPGRVDEIAGLISEPTRPAELLKIAFTLAAERGHAPVDRQGQERIGVVAHHLFLAKATHGVFLPLDRIDEKAVSKAYRDLLKQKIAEQDDGEGVIKELQAL